MNKEKFIKKALNENYEKYIVDSILEKTKDEELKAINVPMMDYVNVYVLTENNIYIFSPESEPKRVPFRKSKLSDVKEIHWYFKNDYTHLALIGKQGHVIFVLKFDDYIDAACFCKSLFREMVLNDPNVEGNPFEYTDYMDDIHTQELLDAIVFKEEHKEKAYN